jgi:predicted lactoylglutathione lyase
MVTQVFINLPINSTKKSNSFFEQPGFKFNPLFSNEFATCQGKLKMKGFCIQEQFQI